MVSLSFLYPRFLLLLLLIPLFIFVYFLGLIYNKKKAIAFANFEAMERIYNIEVFSKNFLTLYLNIIILCLLVFSLAGIVLVFDAKTSSFSYVLAIDNSDSMKVADMGSSRLNAAKDSAKRFVDLLPQGVDFAVIGFSGDAKIYHELDNSKLKIKMAVDAVDFGEIQGTNIYNAVLTANKILGDAKMKSIILISDGQLNVGDTYQIIRYANRNNLVLNTILIGTALGGQTQFNTTSTADEEVMKALAFNTDGKFFRVSDLEVLDEAFSDISGTTNRQVFLDISMYFLIGALILFSFSWITHNFRFKTIP